MNKLGTENAFQVALRAARHQEEGNIVYPFHLGDLNFKTPEPVTEAMFKAVRDGKTGYCPAALPKKTTPPAKRLSRLKAFLSKPEASLSSPNFCSAS